MKKLLMLALVAISGTLLFSCGPNMYNTQSSGKDNTAYVIVLTDGPKFENVSVVVDGHPYIYDKVHKIKNRRKAQKVRIEPGRHNVKVLVGAEVMTDEDIFIGLQETKQVVLR